MRTERRVYYCYKGKRKSFTLIETDRQIATVCLAEEDEAGNMDIQVVTPGMDYDEICECFPPSTSATRNGKEYNLVGLIRSIIYEAYRNEGIAIDPGNVRHFWYTHIKFVIEDVLGSVSVPVIDGVDSE